MCEREVSRGRVKCPTLGDSAIWIDMLRRVSGITATPVACSALLSTVTTVNSMAEVIAR